MKLTNLINKDGDLIDENIDNVLNEITEEEQMHLCLHIEGRKTRLTIIVTAIILFTLIAILIRNN